MATLKVCFSKISGRATWIEISKCVGEYLKHVILQSLRFKILLFNSSSSVNHSSGQLLLKQFKVKLS